MTRRHAIAVGSLVVAAALCPGRASAQHQDAKPANPPPVHGTTATPAAKPAQTEKQPPAPTPKPAAPASVKKEAGSNELHAAIARIREAVAAPVPKTASAPKAAPRPTSVAAATPARLPRIRLSWRASLMWPSELDAQPAGDSPDRLSLSWR